MEGRKKQIIIGIILIVIIIIVIIMISNKKEKSISLENGISSENVQLEGVTFSHITSHYEEGITTIRANIKNHTSETKSIEIEILLKDENGNQVGNMRQKLDNLEAGQEKVLTTGVMGDYSHIKDIEMKVVKE